LKYIWLKVLSLEQRNWQKNQGEDSEQIAMAKLYLYQAVDIVTQKERKCFFVEGDEQRMMLMGLRRFTKYTNMPNIVALRETIQRN
jgi:hypothetical protein